jgi:hypothetical protein
MYSAFLAVRFSISWTSLLPNRRKPHESMSH